MRKPRCPRCGSLDTVPIINGYPTQAGEALVRRGAAVYGGCIQDPDPSTWRNRHCRACGHEWRAVTFCR